MEVELAQTEASPPIRIEYNEFKARIERGELGPKTLIRDRVLTRGEWWPLDELNIFHNHSPKPYPKGERLRRKSDDAKQLREAQERCSAQRATYLHGNLIDERYYLRSLPELFGEKGVRGITRLYVLRSFAPERIFTFTFGRERICIYVAQGHTALWYSLPQATLSNGLWKESVPTPFDPGQIHRAIGELGMKDAPWPFKQWSTVEETSKLAPSCASEFVTDGVSFRHRLLSETEELAADWRNPSLAQHASQLKLLNAYYECITAANLERFWQGAVP